jgi:hypothetical protein
LGGAGEVAVEAEVGAGESLGGGEDLAGVLGEVLDDVVDGFEDGDVVVLGTDGLGELFGGESFEDGAGELDGVVELGPKLGLGDAGAGGELGVAGAGIGLVIDAVEDPLPDVAGEVKAEVGDGVGGLGGAEPELVLIELLEADVDAGEELAKLAGGELEEEVFSGGHGKASGGMVTPKGATARGGR